jgi:hypothetical protein
MKFCLSERSIQIDEKKAAQLIIHEKTPPESIAELLICFAFSLEVASAVQQRKKTQGGQVTLERVDGILLEQFEHIISNAQQDQKTSAAAADISGWKIQPISTAPSNHENLITAYKVAHAQARDILHTNGISLFNFLLTDNSIDQEQLQSNVNFLLERLPARSLTPRIFNALWNAAKDKDSVLAHYEKNIDKIPTPFNNIQMEFIFNLITESKLPKLMPILQGDLALDESTSALYVKAAIKFQASLTKYSIKEKVEEILSDSTYPPDLPTLHFLSQVYWSQIPAAFKSGGTSNIFFEAREKSPSILSVLIADSSYQLPNIAANTPYLQQLLFEEATNNSESDIAPLVFLYRKLPVGTDDRFLTRIRLEIQRRCSCFSAQGTVLFELLSDNQPLLEKFIDSRTFALKIFRSLAPEVIKKNINIIAPIFFSEKFKLSRPKPDDGELATFLASFNDLLAELLKLPNFSFRPEGDGAPSWLNTVFKERKDLLIELLMLPSFSFHGKEELEIFTANYLAFLKEILFDNTQIALVDSRESLFSQLAAKHLSPEEIEQTLAPGAQAPKWLQSTFEQNLDLFSAALNTNLHYTENQNWLKSFLQNPKHLQCFIQNYSFRSDQELENFLRNHATSLKAILLDEKQANLVKTYSALFKQFAASILTELKPNELIALILQELFEEQDLTHHNFESVIHAEAFAFLLKDNQWQQLSPKSFSCLMLLAHNHLFSAIQSNETLIQAYQELVFEFILRSSESKDKEKLLAVLKKLLTQPDLIEKFTSRKCSKTQEKAVEWLSKNPDCETLCFAEGNFIQIVIRQNYRFTKIQEQKILITCSNLKYLFQAPDLKNALQAILIRQFENFFRDQKVAFTAATLRTALLAQLQLMSIGRHELTLESSQGPKIIISPEDSYPDFFTSIQILICDSQIRNSCWPALMSSPRLLQQFIDTGNQTIWHAIFDASGDYVSELQSTLSQYSGKPISLANFEQFCYFAQRHQFLSELLPDIMSCFKLKTGSSTNSSARSSRPSSPLPCTPSQSQLQSSLSTPPSSLRRHSINSLSFLVEKVAPTHISSPTSPLSAPLTASARQSLVPSPAALDTASGSSATSDTDSTPSVSALPAIRRSAPPAPPLPPTESSGLPRKPLPSSAPTTPTSALSKPVGPTIDFKDELTARLRQQQKKTELSLIPISPTQAATTAAAKPASFAETSRASRAKPAVLKGENPIAKRPSQSTHTAEAAAGVSTTEQQPQRGQLLADILKGVRLKKVSPSTKREKKPTTPVAAILAARRSKIKGKSDSSSEESDISSEHRPRSKTMPIHRLMAKLPLLTPQRKHPPLVQDDHINPPGAFGSPPAKSRSPG